MSRIYAALRKAEEERREAEPASRRPPTLAVSPSPGPAADRSDLLGYEQMRMWLRNPAAPAERMRTVMVVACRSGSGATTTTALFAKTLAEGKRSRVIMVDGNFRTPGLNLVFRVANEGGLADVTAAGSPLDPHVQKTDRENLYILTSGAWPSALADAFDEQAIDDLLRELESRFDFVVIDGAPVLEFPDALALAARVDGVVLVVESEKTLIEDAQRAKQELERAGAKIAGVVLNRHVEVMPAVLQRFLGSF
jgi:protein-tyrosine kinase